MRNISRRTFLQVAAGTAAAGVAIPQLMDMKAFSMVQEVIVKVRKRAV